MNKDKLCKRPLTVNGIKRLKSENVVGYNDDGYDFYQVYQNYYVDQTWEANKKVKYDEIEHDGLPEDQFKRLVNLFEKWSSGSTKISVFMQGLDPDKIYKKHEMMEHCLLNSIRITDITPDKSGKSNKYGNIIRVNGYDYFLNPCLVNSYKQFF